MFFLISADIDISIIGGKDENGPGNGEIFVNITSLIRLAMTSAERGGWRSPSHRSLKEQLSSAARHFAVD